MLRTPTRLALVFAALACAHCGDDGSSPTPPADAGTDAAQDAAVDGADDVSPDAQLDVGGDVIADVGPDADVGEDVDAGTDAVADADAVEDTEVDTGPAMASIGGTNEGTEYPAELALWVDGEEVERLIAEPGVAFAFSDEVAVGTAFEVTVTTHPIGHFCAVEASSETVTEDVAVTVACEFATDVETNIWGRADGEIFRVIQRYEEFEDGYRVLGYESSAEGADGVSFTADDPDVEGWMQENYFDGLSGGATAYQHIGDDGEPWTDDDAIDRYVWFEEHPNGQRLLELSVTDPGPDGLWRTDDDVPGTGSEHGIVVEGLRDGAYDCWASWEPGADGLLETEDDELQDLYWRPAAYNAVFDAYDREWQIMDGPGDDGEPCTDDDERLGGFGDSTDFESEDGLRRYEFTLEGFREVFLFPDGRTQRSVEYATVGDEIGGPDVDEVTQYSESFIGPLGDLRRARVSGPGEDGEWFTPDDVFERVDNYLLRHPLTGDPSLLVVYAEDAPLRGADGEWGTADDVAVTWAILTESESLQCWVTHASAGADGLWDTTDCGNGATDDTLTSVAWTRIDEQGRPVELCTSTAPGVDGVWATDDDVLSAGSCASREWLDDTRGVWRTYEDAGDDGVPFTEDDEASRTFLVEIDASGGMTLYAEVSGPGADETWYTNDDEVMGEYTRWTRDAFRQVLTTTIYGGAGDDGFWMTEDDVIVRHTVMERVKQAFLMAT